MTLSKKMSRHSFAAVYREQNEERRNEIRNGDDVFPCDGSRRARDIRKPGIPDRHHRTEQSLDRQKTVVPHVEKYADNQCDEECT